MISRDQANKNANHLKKLQETMTSLQNDNRLLSTRKVELFSEIEQLEKTAKLVDDKRSDINERIQKTDTIKANVTQELNKLPGSVKPAPIVMMPSSFPPPPPPPPPKSSTPIPKKNVVKKAPDSQPKDIAQASANKPDKASLSSTISKLRKTPVSPQHTQNKPSEEQNIFSKMFKDNLISPNISATKQKLSSEEQDATKQKLSSEEQDAAYQKQFEEEKAAFQNKIDEATSKQLELARQVSNLIAKLDAIKESQQVHEKTLQLETDFIQQIDTKTDALRTLHITVATDVTHELSKIAQKEAAKKAEEEAAQQSKENASMGNKAPPPPPAPPPPAPPGPPSAMVKGSLEKNKSEAINAEIKKSPGSSAAQPISQAAIQEKYKQYQERREQQAIQDYLVNELIDMLDRLKKSDGFGNYTDDQTLLLEIIDETQLENLETSLNKLPKSADDTTHDTLKKTLTKIRQSVEGNDKQVMKENPQVKNTIMDFITNHPERDKLLESTKNIKQAKEDAQAKAAQEALETQLNKINANKEENERIKMQKIQTLIEKNVSNAVNDFSSVVEEANLKNTQITQTIEQQQQKLAQLDEFIIEIKAELEQRKKHLIDATPSNPLPVSSDTPQAITNEKPDDFVDRPTEEISTSHTEDASIAQAEEEIKQNFIDPFPQSPDVVPPTDRNHIKVETEQSEEKIEPITHKQEATVEPLNDLLGSRVEIAITPAKQPRVTQPSSTLSREEIKALSDSIDKFHKALKAVELNAIQPENYDKNMLKIVRALADVRNKHHLLSQPDTIPAFTTQCSMIINGKYATTSKRNLRDVSTAILTIDSIFAQKSQAKQPRTLPALSEKQEKMIKAFDEALKEYKQEREKIFPSGQRINNPKYRKINSAMIEVDNTLTHFQQELKTNNDFQTFIEKCTIFFEHGISFQEIPNLEPKYTGVIGSIKKILNTLTTILGFQNKPDNIAHEKQANLKTAVQKIKEENPEKNSTPDIKKI